MTMRTPLNHKPLREVVADEIRRMIASGEIEGGQRLIEDRLAEQMGVSRNPIREAIRSLEGSGLVEVIPRRGAYAVRIDSEDLRRIQEIREVLEAWIVEHAALNRTDIDLQKLDACIAEGRAATDSGNRLQASEMHRRFHALLEEASGNPYVSVAIEPLRQRTELVFTMLDLEAAQISWDEHQELRDAIAASDTTRSRTLMVGHIGSALDRFQRQIPATHA